MQGRPLKSFPYGRLSAHAQAAICTTSQHQGVSRRLQHRLVVWLFPGTEAQRPFATKSTAPKRLRQFAVIAWSSAPRPHKLLTHLPCARSQVCAYAHPCAHPRAKSHPACTHPRVSRRAAANRQCATSATPRPFQGIGAWSREPSHWPRTSGLPS